MVRYVFILKNCVFFWAQDLLPVFICTTAVRFCENAINKGAQLISSEYPFACRSHSSKIIWPNTRKGGGLLRRHRFNRQPSAIGQGASVVAALAQGTAGIQSLAQEFLYTMDVAIWKKKKKKKGDSKRKESGYVEKKVIMRSTLKWSLLSFEEKIFLMKHSPLAELTTLDPASTQSSSKLHLGAPVIASYLAVFHWCPEEGFPCRSWTAPPSPNRNMAGSGRWRPLNSYL